MSSSTAAQTLPVGRRFPVRALIVVLTLAVAAVAGYVAYDRYTIQQPATTVVTAPPISVRKGAVTATVSATGNVVAARTVKLSFTQGGRLKELLVQLGERVNEGQPLARLDATQLQLKVEQAQSNLRIAQPKLEQAKLPPKAEELVQARASLDSAKARLEEIVGGPQAADIQAAASGLESAQANVRSAQARLDQLKAGSSNVDVVAAEQVVASARANVQKLQVDLERVKAGATADELAAATMALEQARTSLWATQVDRDATCGGRAQSTQCQSANARVSGQELSVQAAQAKIETLKAKPDPKDVAVAEGALTVARESLRSAEARLAQVRSGATSSDLQSAQSSLESARASLVSAQAKFDQLRAGPRATEVRQVQAAVDQAQAALNLKMAPPTAADLAPLEEAVRQAEIALKQAQSDLDGATLVAPFGGIVGALTVNVGELIGGGAAIVTLVDPKASRVDVTVDETDIGQIAIGNPATITFDSLAGRTVRAKVLGIAPSATLQQGVAIYTVAVGIDQPNVNVPIGMTANVNIVTEQRNNVLLVPNRAVRRQGRNQTIDVLVDGKTQSRVVRTGLSNDQVTEIVEGVAEGDQVVIPTTQTVAPRVPGVPGQGGQGFGGGPGPGGAVFIAKPGGGP